VGNTTPEPSPPRPAAAIEPNRAEVDERLRRAAQMEEMVARTHERAATLYESWVEYYGDKATAELQQRARMHREIADAVRSVDRLAERTIRGFEARVEAGTSKTGKARCLLALSTLEHLSVLIARRIEERVAACRHQGASWAQIAAALHISRQSAHQRFRHGRTDVPSDE
jgi:hypothetical protein